MDNSTFSLIFAVTVASFGGISMVATYFATKGIINLKLPPSIKSIEDEYQQIEEKGTRKVTNILSVLPNGVIRTRDGNFIRGYRITPSETFYSADREIEKIYDRLALTITSELPKDCVFQIRFKNAYDRGYKLKEQLNYIYKNSEDIHPTAQVLKEEEINYYLDIAETGSFRSGQFTLWIKIPTSVKGEVKNGFQSLIKNLKRPNGIKEFLISNDKLTVLRLKEEEEVAYNEAIRNFRTIEQQFPVEATPLTYGETCVDLRINHNPNFKSMPIPPRSPDTDWQGYISRTNIRHSGSWYLWHGNTPVTVVTLFEPPESTPDSPNCYAGMMKFITTNPSLQGRCEVVTEFITLDKDQSIKKVKDEIKKLRKSNINSLGKLEFKNDKDRRSYEEKKRMVKELSSPGKALTNMRFHIVVRGEEVQQKDSRKRILDDLDKRTHQIISLVHEQLQGSQAAIEDSVALRSIYEQTLLGELSAKENHREIKEQALSLACFIPIEADWCGMKNDPHNFFINTSGELTGLNLLRNPHTGSPGTVVLGASGSGKSVTGALIIEGFLATIPHARVRACDYGGSLAPLVNLFNGRYFRFNERDAKTINIWDYEGLGQGERPDAEQIELVTKDTLILLGIDDTGETARDYAAIIEKCVRQVYTDEVPRNIPGVRRHEPVLSHLIRKLRVAAFENADDRLLAARIASRLENFEGNAWVDSPTHETFRSNSRFDVFELSSLEKLPETLRACLAFRVGSRIGSGDEDIEGFNPATLVYIEETHELVNSPHLKYALRGAERNFLHGRKKNKIPLIVAHSFDQIKDYPDIISNIGTVIVGIQDDVTSLAKHRNWNNKIVESVYNIDNRKGLAHQFLLATGQGKNQKATTIQVSLSPIGLWTFTTDPPEDQARKVLSQAMPHWDWSQVLMWLAQHYPRGLSYNNKKAIDEDLLDNLIEQEKERNPEYRKYIRQMEKMGTNIKEVPEDMDMDELFEELDEMIDQEFDQIAKDSFAPISKSGNNERIKQLGINIPGVIIDEIRE